MPEMMFILGLALLIFGPAQLPKIGRQIGKALGEFKRASNEFKNQLEDEVRKLEIDQLKQEAQQFKENAKQMVALDPPANTIAQGGAAAEAPAEKVESAALSHDPAWEDPARTIHQPAPAPAAPKAAGE
jgi:sec-independent protein translocase protein TatB